MGALQEQKPKLSLLSPRATLMQINADLLRVHSQIRPYAALQSEGLTNLELMTICLEDRRFFFHRGVDFLAIVREVFRAATFRRHGGASTIDMQLVRTATGYKQRTVSRKIYEIFLATLIQFKYSKIVILRSYLACAYFGSRLHGANRAADALFKKTANELSMEEAAQVASLLVYPRPLKEGLPWQLKVQRRARYGQRVYVSNEKRFKKLPG